VGEMPEEKSAGVRSWNVVMKRALTIVAVADLIILAIFLHTSLKDWLWTHPWWHSFLVAVPTIALAVIAFVELRHSEKANELRDEANRLTKELDAERNKNLQQIADYVKPQLTQADKNAAKLRKYWGQRARVTEPQGDWGPMGAEIVDVSDENVVTLFTPAGYSSTSAWEAHAHCNDVEILEMATGSCPVQIKFLKRYGETVQWGEIKRWKDRNSPTLVQPAVEKGQIAYYATYVKVGTTETRELHVFAAKDGSNYFVLEAKPDGTFFGNNVDISKRFMALQVEYEAAGFTKQQVGPAGSKHRLYIKTT
jgi:hypothetical protein